MKFTRNVKAISKLLFILLLLMATIIGAILSYLWVMGYYVSLEQVFPEDITVNITDYAFDYQNTSFFNVTIQCPTSYKSKETANITQIIVSTEDGDLHDSIDTDPPLPYKFQQKGEEETFKCSWNWANYTGETVKIIAFIEDGSGPTFEVETPLVKLGITDIRFKSTISVTHFNLTVQNSATSVTHVNITGVSIENETISAGNVSIPLPHPLYPGESVSFKCMWNWIKYQDKSVTVAIYTLQGYAAYNIHPTPKPVNLTITDVLFNVTDTAHFNVTVQNSADSPTYVNITRITITMENGTSQEIIEVSPSLSPSYPLEPSANVTFRCSWNWTDYREKNATITVYTLQDFTVSSTQATAARVLLAITDVLFDVVDPSYFNVTVGNSEYSLTQVNITRITVTFENGTSLEVAVESPPFLPYSLPLNNTVTFKCSWNWTNYQGENVIITVETLEGYEASSDPYTIPTIP